MATINYAKDKLLDLHLKLSPKQRKIWRNIPATTKEIKQSYIDSMEKCTGKTHEQILEGSAEDYSYARRMMVEKNGYKVGESMGQILNEQDLKNSLDETAIEVIWK